MSPPTSIILTTLGQGSSVIREQLSNVKMVILWAEGYNLRWSYPFDVKFSFILIGLPDGSTFLFDLIICHDLINILRTLLECPAIIKVICNQLELRRVLWNELKINLASFYDIQLALASSFIQNSSFTAICTGVGLKNRFADENSAKNPRYWLKRPLTPQMLDIASENTLLLHKIYQNLTFGASGVTHDLRICQDLSQNAQEPTKSKNPIKLIENEVILISCDVQAKAVLSELQENANLKFIGVKFGQGKLLGRSVDLLTIGLPKKTLIFDMSTFFMTESKLATGLKIILELPCLKKVIYGAGTKFQIQEKCGIELVDVYDLKLESLRVIPKQDCPNRTLFGLSKFLNPDLSVEIEDQMGSRYILVSIGAAMKLYFYLFEAMRRLYKNEVKIPLPKGLNMSKAPILPPKSAKIQKMEIPGTSNSNSLGHDASKPVIFIPKLLLTSKIICKHKDFMYANECIRNHKIISLDCKSSNGIALIVVGTPEEIFLFDVNGKPPMSMPILKGIIEDRLIKKIMYKAGDMLQELRNQFDILPWNMIDVFTLTCGPPEALKMLASLKKMQNEFESSKLSFWKGRPVKGDSLTILPQIASFLIQNHEALTQKVNKGPQKPLNYTDIFPKASLWTFQGPPTGTPMGNDIGTELLHLREMIEGGDVKANLLKSVDHITGLVQKGSQSGPTGENKTVTD